MRTNSAPPSTTVVQQMATKVPEVTAYFWITKVLTTGMGEAASDWLSGLLGLGPAAALALGALVVALVVQFRLRRYVAGAYWSTVVLVSVFGTMAADGLHSTLHVSHQAATAGFAVLLVVVFALWYRSEGTLSIHSITTRRREVFYWATVLTTFALGTAAGDLTAGGLGWGYLPSAVVFAAVIAIPAIGFRWSGLNAVLAFWTAYTTTRPLGASLADWMAVLPRHGGLGLHTGPVSLLWTIAILGFVVFLAVTHRDVQRPQAVATVPAQR